jgi:hypothetical protein
MDNEVDLPEKSTGDSPPLPHVPDVRPWISGKNTKKYENGTSTVPGSQAYNELLLLAQVNSSLLI